MNRRPWSLVALAGLATGVSDGLFASVLSAVFYGSTVTRLWQGVASTVLGKGAYSGGALTTLAGLLIHFAVALGWSAVFFILVTRVSWTRRVLWSSYGALKVASMYGPTIWTVMSLVVIPLLLRKPPTIQLRWWVQGIGHIPFVALPMVTVIGEGLRRYR